MLKILSAISFSLMITLGSFEVSANHCGGGHKEIKETKETTEDSTKTSDKTN